MCQCWMTPAAVTATSTFLVLLIVVGGRNRSEVQGRARLLPLCRLYASLPVATLKTRIAPSPQPADRNLPSGENRTQNTSEELSLTVRLACSRGPAGAASLKICGTQGTFRSTQRFLLCERGCCFQSSMIRHTCCCLHSCCFSWCRRRRWASAPDRVSCSHQPDGCRTCCPHRCASEGLGSPPWVHS